MSSLNYTDNEYKTYLEMDKNKHLLVEGRDDFLFFHILCEEFLGVDWPENYKIVVDKAELLLSSDNQPHGNREKNRRNV